MLLAAWRVTEPLWSWNLAFTSAAAAATAGMLGARRGAGPGQRDQWTWWAAAPEVVQAFLSTLEALPALPSSRSVAAA